MAVILLLTTCDVESLFTKIPLDPLIDILSEHLPTVCSTQSESRLILDLLRHIIKFNTFSSNNQFYLQKIGLPMGWCLSGSLANIYLGYLEMSLLSKHTSSILLYSRYMDDILVIMDTSTLPINTFLHDLRETFKLSITSSSSPSYVTFLDTRVHLHLNSFNLSFYSKTSLLFRLPFASDNRPISQQQSLFQSQLLRMWRLATKDNLFSMHVRLLISQLDSTGLKRQLCQVVFQFLKPVEVSKNSWLTHHKLCDMCLDFCTTRSIFARKVLMIGNHPMSSRLPICCHSPNVHFIISSPLLSRSIITRQHDLHSLIHLSSTLNYQPHNLLSSHTHILPFSVKQIFPDNPIFQKFQ